MSHTHLGAPRALSAADTLLLKARHFVDYCASCGNSEARTLVAAIDAHLAARRTVAVTVEEVEHIDIGVEAAWPSD